MNAEQFESTEQQTNENNIESSMVINDSTNSILIQIDTHSETENENETETETENENETETKSDTEIDDTSHDIKQNQDTNMKTEIETDIETNRQSRHSPPKKCDTDKECLFCLNNSYEEFLSDEDSETTYEREYSNRIHTEQQLQNFKHLFPCNCSVYAHPLCLQIWLSQQQACPICITPIIIEEPDDTFVSIQPIHSIHSIINRDSSNQTESSSPREHKTCSTTCVIKRSLYFSIAGVIVYLFIGNLLQGY